MAKHITQTLTITVSKLVRDTEPTKDLIEAELIEQLEAVITELVDDKVLVEVSVTK